MSDTRAISLKVIAQWSAVTGTAVAAFAALCVLAYLGLTELDWIRTLLREHVRAIVGLPMAAVSAFCLVVILEATSGRIEFEVLAFKFRGAAGPVVLWVLSFLAFVLALRILW